MKPFSQCLAVAGKYTVAHCKKNGFAICSAVEELFQEHNIYFLIIIMQVSVKKCIWEEENTVNIAYEFFTKIASTGQFYTDMHTKQFKKCKFKFKFLYLEKKKHESEQFLLIFHSFRSCLNIHKMTYESNSPV